MLIELKKQSKLLTKENNKSLTENQNNLLKEWLEVNSFIYYYN